MAKLKQRKVNFTPYVFLLPSGILFLLFTFIPILADGMLSFCKWDFFDPPVFVDIANWKKILCDVQFFSNLLTTFKFVLIIVPLTITLGIILALFVDKLHFAKNFFRSIYFAPVVTSSVAMSFIVKAMFREETGIINYILGFLGIGNVKWLSSPSWVIMACVIFIVWQGVGNSMLIFLAGLQGIPETTFEAASIDGSNTFNTFFRITLPLLSPATFFVLVTTTISSIQIFDQIYTLTKGGPGYATTTIVYSIYSSAFIDYKAGYASALSLVLMLILMLITFFQWKHQERWVNYDQ